MPAPRLLRPGHLDSRAAASWNCPASAAATKVRTASISIGQTLLTQHLVVARRRLRCLMLNQPIALITGVNGSL
jgi:hypothetical protein